MYVNHEVFVTALPAQVPCLGPFGKARKIGDRRTVYIVVDVAVSVFLYKMKPQALVSLAVHASAFGRDFPPETLMSNAFDISGKSRFFPFYVR